MKTSLHFIKTGITIWLIILCAFCSLKSFSQNWTGNVSSDWNNSANWSAWPLNSASITINPVNYSGVSASPNISSPSAFIPDEITIVNGGTLTIDNSLITNNDMIIDQGGVVVLNSGSFNIGRDLKISDGKPSNPSMLNMNNGLLQITEDLIFKNVTGNYMPALSMTTGTLTVQGDVTWNGQSPGAGRPKLLVKGGVANLKGKLMNMPSSTVDMYLSVTNGTLNYSGDFIKTIALSDSIVQIYPASFVISDTATWNHEGTFYVDSATTTFNGSTQLTGLNGEFKFYHLNVQTGKKLDHVSPTHIYLKGNMINNGTFDSHINSVIFTGEHEQTLSGTSTSTIGNLISNNTSAEGITLNQSLVISKVLAMFSGKLNTNASHLLTLLDGSSCNTGAPGSFINGPVKKIGNDIFEFPIGKNTIWARAEMTAPSDTNTEITVEYFPAAFTNTTSFASPLAGVSGVEYWKVTKGNTDDSVRFSFYWEDAAYSTITNCADMTLANWDGTQWINVPSSLIGSCNANGSGKLTATTKHLEFTYFTFGFFDVVTGLASISKDPFIRFYPNPNNGKAILEVKDNYLNSSYKLMDIEGKVIIENQLMEQSRNELDYTSQPSGVYYLEVNRNGVTSRIKIVKI